MPQFVISRSPVRIRVLALFIIRYLRQIQECDKILLGHFLDTFSIPSRKGSRDDMNLRRSSPPFNVVTFAFLTPVFGANNAFDSDDQLNLLIPNRLIIMRFATMAKS